MQKWIGVGRVEGEPVDVAFRGKHALLIRLSCDKPWKPDSPDSVPVLFVGKRVDAFKRWKPAKCDGVLACVIGELSVDATVVRRGDESEYSIACIAVSVEFWDGAAIEARRHMSPKKNRAYQSDFKEE